MKLALVLLLVSAGHHARPHKAKPAPAPDRPTQLEQHASPDWHLWHRDPIVKL